MRSAAQRAAQLKAAKASALARKKKSLKGQSVYMQRSSFGANSRRTYDQGNGADSGIPTRGRMGRENSKNEVRSRNKNLTANNVEPNKAIGDARRYKNANGGTITAAGLSTSRNLAKGGSMGQSERMANREAIRLKGISMVVGKRNPKMK